MTRPSLASVAFALTLGACATDDTTARGDWVAPVDHVRAQLASEGTVISPDSVAVERSLDLGGDASISESLVYIYDPILCGSGGCTLFVLSRENRADTWQIVDRLSVARLPVYDLGRGADGWMRLGVTVGGGGMKTEVMRIPHSSDGYADNPTVSPAARVDVGDAPVILDEPAD